MSEVLLWQGQTDDAPVEAAEGAGAGGKDEAVTEEKEKKGERGAEKNVFIRFRETAR